jgi:hypothetical protein
MPGKSGQVIFRIVVTEIIQQQKGIKILRSAEAESTLQLYAGALKSGRRLNNPLNRTE